MMIELAFTLTDYLIKFFQKREDNADEYFERYISPDYEAAEKVYSDYLSIMNEIKKKIEQHENPLEIIKFLEEGRLKYLPIRMRLRAEITSRFEYVYYGDGVRYTNLDKLPDFERGILGILMGGLAPFEDKSSISTPYYNSHALLDVLYRFSSFVISGQTDERNLIYTIDEQISALNRAWSDVVKGYAEYKKIVVPTPSGKAFIKQKASSKREGD